MSLLENSQARRKVDHSRRCGCDTRCSHYGARAGRGFPPGCWCSSAPTPALPVIWIPYFPAPVSRLDTSKPRAGPGAGLRSPRLLGRAEPFFVLIHAYRFETDIQVFFFFSFLFLFLFSFPSFQPWALPLCLPLTSHVTLAKSLHLPEPQFPHLSNGGL